jgi:hypothetical protein
LCTFVRRSAKVVGVVSLGPSKTTISPLFSATKTRPSREKRIDVGSGTPEKAVVSWKPGDMPGSPVRNVASLEQPPPSALEAQPR